MQNEPDIGFVYSHLDPEESKTWGLIWMQQFVRGNFALTYCQVRITASIILNYWLGKWNLNLSGYYHGSRRMLLSNSE